MFLDYVGDVDGNLNYIIPKGVSVPEWTDKLNPEPRTISDYRNNVTNGILNTPIKCENRKLVACFLAGRIVDELRLVMEAVPIKEDSDIVEQPEESAIEDSLDTLSDEDMHMGILKEILRQNPDTEPVSKFDVLLSIIKAQNEQIRELKSLQSELLEVIKKTSNRLDAIDEKVDYLHKVWGGDDNKE